MHYSPAEDPLTPQLRCGHAVLELGNPWPPTSSGYIAYMECKAAIPHMAWHSARRSRLCPSCWLTTDILGLAADFLSVGVFRHRFIYQSFCPHFRAGGWRCSNSLAIICGSWVRSHCSSTCCGSHPFGSTLAWTNSVTSS